MYEKFEKIMRRMLFVPFVIGIAGYMLEGYSFVESAYGSLALYAINPVYDENNILIWIGKYLTVLVAFGLILSLIRTLCLRMEHWFLRKRKDSTIVFGDPVIGEKIADGFAHAYFVAKEDFRHVDKAASYVLCFASDEENLDFYTDNRKRFKNRPVYMLLNDTDASLLKSTSDSNIHYFNVYDLLARDFWKEYSLYDQKDAESLDIAILGYGKMGSALFRYGYLNNLFGLRQKITYHLYEVPGSQRAFLENLKFGNDDRLIIHDLPATEAIPEIAKCDRILIADAKDSYEVLQSLLKTGADGEVFYYTAEGIEMEEFFLAPLLTCFGNLETVLTEENIKKENLYRLAKLFNFDYELRYAKKTCPVNYEEEMENKWRALSGFHRGANIARADHYFIELCLHEEGKLEPEDYWRIEHVRWARYYYINGWSYASVRDNAHKKHHCLVPYDELPFAEKEKDGIYDTTLQKEIEALAKK